MNEADDKKPWIEWKFNPKCLKQDCSCCQYVYGSGHPKAGQKVIWIKTREVPPEDKLIARYWGTKL